MGLVTFISNVEDETFVGAEIDLFPARWRGLVNIGRKQ
jgi:hypothetical protein